MPENGAIIRNCSERKISTAMALFEDARRADRAQRTRDGRKQLNGVVKRRGIIGKIFAPVTAGLSMAKRLIVNPAKTLVKEVMGPAILLGIGALLIFSCTGMFPPGIPLCVALGGASAALYGIAAAIAAAGIFMLIGKIIMLPIIAIKLLLSPLTGGGI